MILANLLVSALLFPFLDWGSNQPGGEASVLRTLEGKVTEVGEIAGEGQLPVVTLNLQTREGSFQVVVAPPAVLADIGFSVAVGDQVRARVFFDPARHQAYAQKLLNQSQDLMVRLRTLRHEPLWDAAGNWQGSPADLPTTRELRETNLGGRGGRGGRPTPERPVSPRPPG